MTDDSKRISQAKGIGKKTAEKLIIELKDKLKVVDLEVLSASTEQTLHSTYIDEALMGLTGLGYTETEALHAIKHAQHADSTSELIKQALIFLAKE